MLATPACAAFFALARAMAAATAAALGSSAVPAVCSGVAFSSTDCAAVGSIAAAGSICAAFFALARAMAAATAAALGSAAVVSELVASVTVSVKGSPLLLSADCCAAAGSSCAAFFALARAIAAATAAALGSTSLAADWVSVV